MQKGNSFARINTARGLLPLRPQHHPTQRIHQHPTPTPFSQPISLRNVARCSAFTTALSTADATPDAVLAALEPLPLESLMAEAAALRDENSFSNLITFSPKVFIPLTRLCRDSCGYCTFAQPPVPGRRAYMTVDEVKTVARAGAELGCTEALFTLGDKPELKYKEAAAELAAMGFSSTLEYVAAAAGAVLKETGLLPHVNAGVMSREELRSLRAVSVSQGLMLESLSPQLLLAGAPHYDCPDKDPAARQATLEAAGLEGVPFTTGILVGIGETRKDRIEALMAIRDAHARHGHVQEVIIQNFRAKKGTGMAQAPEPPLEDLLWTVAAARLILGRTMNIQAPPNLTPETDDASSSSNNDPAASSGWRRLLDAGINDWGGVSPLTRDFVNPERPWPHLAALAAATAQSGKILAPRLPIYPAYLTAAAESGNAAARRWLDGSAGAASPLAAVLRHADVHGLARASTWFAGAASTAAATEVPSTSASSSNSISAREEAVPLYRRRATWQVAVTSDGILEGAAHGPPSSDIAVLLREVLSDSHELSEEEIALLFNARGADFRAVTAAANALRQRMNGEVVTYVVNRNINYTNVCTFGCRFCAFSKGPAAEELRGAPYLLSLEEVSRRTAEAWDRGATEVCMQGGIHPDFTGDTYLHLLQAAKAGAPDIHVHAFSPLEVSQGAATLGWSLPRFLAALRDAGLGSLPGTAAEILDDAVRAELCPDKLSSGEWFKVIEAAHSVSLKTTSTIMFGHIEGVEAWARHLVGLRDLQRRTGGLTEFVPLPFVHMEAPIYRRGRARAGPTLRESILMHSVARLALHPHVTNIQASWVKMGPQAASQLLAAGCNDMGGVLMNESITRAAGAQHGQELGPAAMEALIRGVGRQPDQRTTLYGVAPEEQRAASFAAAPLLVLK